MQLLVKWYGARNAPGPQDFSPAQEWDLFLIVLFTLLGYDVEKLHLIRNNDRDQSIERSSPMVLAKKQKTSNCGSTDDWQYVLNSNEYKNSQTYVSSILKGQQVSSSLSTATESIAESSGKINAQAILFPYLPLVLFSLHLLYEEMKLSSVISEGLPLLGELLYQLSTDLKFEMYAHHYFLDSPSLFCLNTITSQISEADLRRITFPNYVPRRPPSIFETLDSILNGMDVTAFPYLNHINPRTRNIICLTVLVANENCVNAVEVDKYVKLITSARSRVDIQESGNKPDKEVLKKLEEPTTDRIILLYHEMGKVDAAATDTIWKATD